MKRRWKVRVMRKIEVWVDVEAENAEQAEQDAANLPHVLQVFERSAVMSTPKGMPVERIGVED